MNGKGSVQRPVDKDKFDDNWDRIFGKNEVGHIKDIEHVCSESPCLGLTYDEAQRIYNENLTSAVAAAEINHSRLSKVMQKQREENEKFDGIFGKKAAEIFRDKEFEEKIIFSPEQIKDYESVIKEGDKITYEEVIRIDRSGKLFTAKINEDNLKKAADIFFEEHISKDYLTGDSASFERVPPKVKRPSYAVMTDDEAKTRTAELYRCPSPKED